jgi:hypothetical protein
LIRDTLYKYLRPGSVHRSEQEKLYIFPVGVFHLT